MTYKKQIQVH